MNIQIQKLQDSLCKMMCAEVKIRAKGEHLLLVETPFFFPDGDPYQIYIKEQPNGIMRLSDNGHTLMHLSYENDTDKFREGTRGNIFNMILAETGLSEKAGEFYVDTTSESLVFNLFRLGQGITKITDLTFLNRARAESTFYEDLTESLSRIVSSEKIHREYIQREMANGSDYPIDYYIEAPKFPLYVFGIPGRDKARLTTIVLERLLREKVDFDSILVFADQASIPKADLARLSNAGGEMIASLDAQDDLSRKLLRKVSLN